MIFILRKIRKALFTNNKLITYLIYAIGEIVLVVIGILIALSLNNWNESRKEQAQELNYLTGIKTDLEGDLAGIESAVHRYRSKLSRIYFLDSSFNLPNNFTPIKNTIDSIEVGNMVNRGAGFRLTMGSYKVLTSNSSAGLIKNESLLQSIQDLYETRKAILTSVYDDIKRREDYIGQKYAVDKKYSSSKAFFIDNPNKKEVLADFDYYYMQLRLYFNVLTNTKRLMEKVIKDINKELNART